MLWDYAWHNRRLLPLTCGVKKVSATESKNPQTDQFSSQLDGTTHSSSSSKKENGNTRGKSRGARFRENAENGLPRSLPHCLQPRRLPLSKTTCNE